MDLHPFEILRKPIITEKSTDLQDGRSLCVRGCAVCDQAPDKMGCAGSLRRYRNEGEHDEPAGQEEALWAAYIAEEGDKEGYRNAPSRRHDNDI